MEEYLKQFSDKISSVKQLIENLLEGRNLVRALAGVKRVSGLLEKEISLVSRSVFKVRIFFLRLCPTLHTDS